MRFCEECGTQLEDDVRFCEECGAEQEPIVQASKEIPPPENSVVEPGVPVNVVSNTPERNRKSTFLLVPVFIVLVIAVMAGGYLIGQNSTKPMQGLMNDNKNTENSSNTAVPTSQVSNPGATPTQIPVATVTPIVVPGNNLAEKSIFEGYREVEYLGSYITVESPDGLYLLLDNMAKPMPKGYVSDGVHDLEFDFWESVICYPEDYRNSGEVPDEGEAIQVEILDGEIYVCWSYYRNGQQAEIYYDGWIAPEYVVCTGKYRRYYENSLKYFKTPDNILSNNPFKMVMDGEIVETSYSGDDKEKIALGLVYNQELDILRMELYDYEQDAYMCGYAEGTIHYETDMAYYLEPVYQDDGVYWEEIPYTVTDGEKQCDLSQYNIFCEVHLNASEEGISLRWSVHEDGVERVFYDDVFSSKHMQRETYVKHY